LHLPTCEGDRQSARLEGEDGSSLGDCGAGPAATGLLDRELMRTVPSERRAGVVNLLGGFEVRRDGEPVPLTPIAQRLVAFLALQRRPLQRLHVAGMLWTDASEEHANASLRTALWREQRLRPALVSRTATHLALADGVAVDAAEVEALAQRVLAGDHRRAGGLDRHAGGDDKRTHMYDHGVVK
jgi:DNA-binding SARP family transcriptional activator